MLVLTQFVLRLSFGLAVAMGITSPKKVTSGYFRNHAYVLLGLNILALLAALSTLKSLPFMPEGDSSTAIHYPETVQQAPAQLHVWPPFVCAILSFVCAAVWLYERPKVGRRLLFAIAMVSLIGTWLSQPLPYMTEGIPMPYKIIGTYDTGAHASLPQLSIWRMAAVTSGLLLGSTIAAMFLGHWYLNTPTMELAPLRTLILMMAVATIAQAALSAFGTATDLPTEWFSTAQYPLLALRWIAGIVGTSILIYMAWQTLKIPNTQSATGILYVAVITTFLGELTSLLLCGNASFPL